jgi:hypothetical protein
VPQVITPCGGGGGGGGGAGTFSGLTAWQSGCYYGPQWQESTGLAISGIGGDLFVYPIWVPATVNIQGLSTIITTPFGGQFFRMGLYSDSGSGYPTTLLQDTGQFSPGGAGEYFIPQVFTLAAGVYWLAICVNNGNNIAFACFQGSRQTIVATGTITDFTLGQAMSNYHAAGVVGALPNPFPAGQHPHTIGRSPLVTMKTA